MKKQIQSTTLISTYDINHKMGAAFRELASTFEGQVSIESRVVSNPEREALIEIEIKGRFGEQFKHSKEEFDRYLNEILAL